MCFCCYFLNQKTARFRNFMGYNRQWLEETGSEDSHARTLWALGTTLERSSNPSLTGVASLLFERALPPVLSCAHPRPWAFALLGINAYLERFGGDRLAQQARPTLAERPLAPSR